MNQEESVSEDQLAIVRVLSRASPKVLRELNRLTRFGRTRKLKPGQEPDPTPVPSTFKEHIDAAKLRLEACKVWATIKWGKTPKALEVDAEMQAQLDAHRWRCTRPELRRQMLEEQLKAGEITLDQANEMCEIAGDEHFSSEEDVEPQDPDQPFA